MSNNSPESNKEKRHRYKETAREKAVMYLKEKKSFKTNDEKKQFRAENAGKIKAWKESLANLDKTETKLQKKAFKAFKKRKNFVPRCISWSLVVLLIAIVGVKISPTVSMFAEVLGSQKYTSIGPEADAVRKAGYELSDEINEEGFVLLKNEDNVLPLASETGVSIFGDDAYNFVYGGSGSAGADQSDATTLFEAFEKNEVAYNRELDNIYREKEVEKGGTGGVGKMLWNFFTGENESNDWMMLDDTVIDDARKYSDTALIVLSSMEVEGDEIDISLLQINGDGMPNRASMVDKICKSFEHVIFIINSGNVMELGMLDDYPSADAALWVGSPGSLGCNVIADVLSGKVNPSGRTVDTWPVSIEREPSYQNYSSNKFTNLDMYTFEYSEGIYVGYRYYETRFGEDKNAYDENVVFPFGHGLSYTTFDEQITDFSSDRDTVSATINVTNTGSVAGKDVVQLYFMSPFYEESGIEKSAIELAGYAKTNLLNPGESESVTISYKTRDMSSYNEKNGGYVLEHGDYKITIGKNVHEALLSSDTKVYNVAADVTYLEDDKTGVALENKFNTANGGITYLSRTDWEGTFPKASESYTASDEMLDAKAQYEKGETVYNTTNAEMPIMNADNGIKLEDLKGLDYDDPKWIKFLDQFNTNEMIGLAANGGWHTQEISRLGVKASRLLDGPSGINSMFAPFTAVAYPMETVVSSSWNDEMALKLGEAVGDEALVYGVQGWYAPGMNIHRSSIGGRNNEYYFEDPLLSGNMGVASIKGAQSKGIIAFMKHFMCNDLELNARSGVIIFSNEQALREIYLRPFELSVKDGGAYGAMSSFSFIGDKWCGGSSELLQDVLRSEWEFEGVVTTDAALGGWMDSGLAVKYGNDLMLDMGIQSSEKKLKSAYKEDPIGVAYGLRNSTHNICFALVNGTTSY